MKPVQTMKDGSDMIKFGTTEDESSSMVLNYLEVFIEVFWRTKAQRRDLVASSVRR